MNNKVDFILTWVDGNDPEWIKQKINMILNHPMTVEISGIGIGITCNTGSEVLNSSHLG